MVKINKWISSIIIGRFHYKYEYTSPFGEEWLVYRLWFGFIPITYQSITHMDLYNSSDIEKHVKGLNNKQTHKLKLRNNKINKLKGLIS